MPVDRDRAVDASLGERQSAWGPDDVILYHLAIGAGVPPTDARELAYTYEKDLKVLPSFAVVAGGRSARTTARGFEIPGIEYDRAQLLHGEQDLELHRPLPTAAKTRTSARVKGVFDKGKAALVILEFATSNKHGPLYTMRNSVFIRGEGGFGGPAGPKAGNVPPERAPDGLVESRTLPQQALLYRLCGDKNPLHADPEFAKRAGFDRPIIHGLCSYGIACKAVVDAALDGDVSRVSRYQARFAGVAFPGETYLTSWWKEGEQLLLSVRSKERDTPIITHAAITLRA